MAVVRRIGRVSVADIFCPPSLFPFREAELQVLQLKPRGRMHSMKFVNLKNILASGKMAAAGGANGILISSSEPMKGSRIAAMNRDHNRGTSLVGLIVLLSQNIRQTASNRSSYTSDTTSEKIIGGAQVQHMVATSACVLNEIIYGASGAWNDKIFTEFGDHMLGKKLQKQATKIVFDIDGQLSTIERENSSQ